MSLETGKKKRGRPQLSIGDLIIALCLATYFNRPSRKATSVARVIGDRLFAVLKVPAAITLRLAMQSSALTHYLRIAIYMTSDCVRELETRFVVDGSYYKTPNSMIHVQRRGKGVIVLEKIKNAKMHIVAGIKTLMAVAIDVSDGDAHDSTFLLPLLEQFNRRFRIDHVVADAAYDRPGHYEAVAACGGKAYFDQKSNTKVNGSPHHDEMVRNRDEDYDSWFDAYRFRELIECVNSMMKRNIKRVIRARLEQSRDNELLLVCLVHNLTRLMVARIKFAIDIPWVDARVLEMIDRVNKQERAA